MTDFYDDDYDFDIDYDDYNIIADDDDENWVASDINFSVDDEIIDEIYEILLDYEIEFDILRKNILTLVHNRFPDIYYDDISKKSENYINLLKYLESPECTLEELKKYIDSNDKYIKSAVAYNSNITEELITNLFNNDRNEYTYFSLSINNKCPSNIMGEINYSEHTLGRIGIAINPAASDKVLYSLLHKSHAINKLILKNPNCSVEIMKELADAYYAPYIVIHKNCPDYLICYLFEVCAKDRYIDSMNFLDKKIKEGFFSQTVIDYLSRSIVRQKLSGESNAYIDATSSNKPFDYVKLLDNIFVQDEKPINIIDFNQLSGHYAVDEISYNKNDIKYVFDYFGDDGLYVINKIRDFNSFEVSFAEAPIEKLTNLEIWALSILLINNLLEKTGKIYRNVDGYNPTLREYEEYSYNGCKFGISNDQQVKRIKPLVWKLENNSFKCLSNIYKSDKSIDKDILKQIPKFLEEDFSSSKANELKLKR